MENENTKIRTVVIGDDEKVILDMAKYMLKRELPGYNIETYQTGKEVYDRLQAGGVDYLIVDGSMDSSKYNGPNLLELAVLNLPEDKRLRPERTVLFSGIPEKYPLNPLINGVNIVRKPAGLSHIINLIKDVV